MRVIGAEVQRVAIGHGQHIGITQGLANVALPLHFAHAQGVSANAVSAARYFRQSVIRH